jgi:hypothetical protein
MTSARPQRARIVNGDSAIYFDTHPGYGHRCSSEADGVESFFVLHDATAAAKLPSST